MNWLIFQVTRKWKDFGCKDDTFVSGALGEGWSEVLSNELHCAVSKPYCASPVQGRARKFWEPGVSSPDSHLKFPFVLSCPNFPFFQLTIKIGQRKSLSTCLLHIPFLCPRKNRNQQLDVTVDACFSLKTHNANKLRRRAGSNHTVRSELKRRAAPTQSKHPC